LRTRRNAATPQRRNAASPHRPAPAMSGLIRFAAVAPLSMRRRKLGRRWVRIDFESIGVPKDPATAQRLVLDDTHQFQQWLCWLVGGAYRPFFRAA
jgi:hypothetical protein